MNWRQAYREKLRSAEDAVALIPDHSLIVRECAWVSRRRCWPGSQAAIFRSSGGKHGTDPASYEG
jgi:hypothetical protein